MTRLTHLLALSFACAAFAGCGSGGGSSGSSSGATGGPTTVTFLATDAPFAHDIVEHAKVWVEQIRVRRASGFTTLYDGPAFELDLAQLRNGITRELVTADLAPGAYDQIRLILSDASLRLINGDEFSTAIGNFNMTSTDTAGLKLNLSPPLQVGDGVARTLLLDFDLTKTFKAVPGADPLNATSYQLHPVVKVSNLSETGELHGFVRESDGLGGFVGVDSATVYVLAPGELDLNNALQTTATEFDGAYVVLGVDPGVYDLVADLNGREARSNQHQVFAGSVTVVDFVLP